MLKPSRLFHIVMSVAALTWVSYTHHETRLMQITFVLAFFWVLGIFNRWTWISFWSAISLIIIAIVGIFLDFPFGWMLAGALFAYLAHDLSKFALRLRFATIGREDDITLIKRVHFTQIALMTLLGLAISTVVLIKRAQFDLAWGIFLGVSLLWWLGIALVRKKQNLLTNK